MVLQEQENCKDVIYKLYTHMDFESTHTDPEVKRQLKFMTQRETIEISACGFFEVSKTLFFPVIGTVLSYGFVFVHLFKEVIIPKIIKE
jgi:hypothetical protein